MRRLLGTTAGAGILAAGLTAGAVTAQEAEPFTIEENAWTYELQLYIWGTEVGGVANGADFKLGFDEIVENLNFVFMGALKAYRDPWMIYGELGYADIRQGGDASYTINPGPGPGLDVDAVADADIQTTVFSFGGGYQIAKTDRYSAYGTFGVRYLKIAADLELDFDSPAGGRSFQVDGDNDYWDAVIGVSGRAYFDPNWFVTYLADVGTGQSDLTWQLAGGVGYTFDNGNHDLVLGYRHMEWELPDDDLITEYYQSGPMLLWNWRF